MAYKLPKVNQSRKRNDPYAPKAYDRLEGETTVMYRYFNAYRRLGPTRNFEQLSSDLKVSISTLKAYSSKNKWKSRAAAWDDDVIQMDRELDSENLKAMKIRHLEQALEMQEFARRTLFAYLDKIELGEITSSPADTAKILREAMSVERLTRGEPTEVKEERSGPKIDYSKLTDEELKTLHELHKKAQGG